LSRRGVLLHAGELRGVPHFHVCQLHVLAAADSPLPFRERGRG